MRASIFRKTETLVALTIIVMSLVIGIINPVFFSVSNLFDLLRSAAVMGIFAMGVLMVIISGGIDVSFTAIAVFALYTTARILEVYWISAPILVAFGLAMLIGLVLGMVNAFFISRFRLPTLIVTLGTLSLFQGMLLVFVGDDIMRGNRLAPSFVEYSRQALLQLPGTRGTTTLHPAILVTVFIALITWFILDYTMLGRSIYALGGSRESAERAGFNINRTQYFIYGMVGVLAGIGGLMEGALIRQANPVDIVGDELNVIAAVVLGGASLTGGRGTVIGSLLGVALVTIMNNSLILIGVPSTWQRVVIGAIILIGTGIPAWQAQRNARLRSAAV